MIDHCGECGSFPLAETGPLTQEIARLHGLLTSHKAISAIAIRVMGEMTDLLNYRHADLISQAQVRRWRDALAVPIERAQQVHNP